MNHSFLPAVFFCFLLTIFVSIVKVYTNRIESKNSFHHRHHDRRSLQSSNPLLNLISKLTASNGGTNHNFGSTNGVAISNGRIIVGAYGYGTFRGAAYVFTDPNNREKGCSYSQMAKLLANDGQEYEFFGSSVDIDGEIIVVGADGYPSLNSVGAVFVFKILNGDSISQTAKLMAQNGKKDDFFGYSVAIHANFILVGAPGVYVNGARYVGSAYLFVNHSSDSNSPDWTQLMKFQPNDLTEDDFFGVSVAMDDQIAVIGTYDLDANKAYIFMPENGNVNSMSPWTQTAKLVGSGGSDFGFSVAVAGNSIIVGAPAEVNSKALKAGAVFVFTQMDKAKSLSSLSPWTEISKLFASDGATNDYFGDSISISKDASTIVIGADGHDFTSSITNSGTAYLFQKSVTTMMAGWSQNGKFIGADQNSNEYMGSAIAIDNSIVVVGAGSATTSSGKDAGFAYLFGAKCSSEKKKKPMLPCFSGVNTVEVQGKGLITMDVLKVGDYVKTGITQHGLPRFSRLVSFMHMDPYAEYDYLQIFFSDNPKVPLEVSSDHFLYLSNHKVVTAKDIQVGDVLKGDTCNVVVTSIQQIHRQGLYAPSTEDGTIRVSGVLASSYVSLMDDRMISPNNQVALSHMALAPLRMVCNTGDFSICSHEKYSEDGYSMNLLTLIKFGLLFLSFDILMQMAMLLVFAPLLLVLVGMEVAFSHVIFASMMIGGLIIAMSKMKDQKI